MKLTIVLWVVALIQVSAATYAQKISLNVNNASLDEVLSTISKQSGYNFLYNSVMLKSAKPVSISVNNEPLKNVLDECFKNQPLGFVINGNTVVINKRSIKQPIQVITVTGRITDEKGQPLAGTTVKLKGTGIGAIADADGKYTIQLPDGSGTLTFAFLGFATQEIAVENKTQINVTLREQSSALTDVVVIGYGSQKRGDVNGAISSIKAKDIADIPQVSVDQLLQGKAAGVTVAQNSGGPGSNTSVHIRGITSLSSTNEPLYVIDGVAISGDANNSTTTGQSVQLSANSGGEAGVSPISFLNPSDIESIDVLKDASATAIYGSRGSNGVIIITTKRGKTGGGKVSYDGYYGVQDQGKFLDLMNLKQYANLQNQLADDIGLPRRGEFANPDLLGPGTDWQRAIFQSAPMQSHQISYSGATDASDYYVSTSYLNQDGTVIGNNYYRYTIRANVNSRIKNWLSIGTNFSASRSFQNTSLTNNNGLIYTALLSAPDQAVYNADGSFAGPMPGQVGAQINPVAQALSITNNLGRDNVNAAIYTDMKFTKDLTLHSEFDADINNSSAKLFTPTYNFGPLYINSTATLQELRSNSTYWSWKEYLTYQHVFAVKHNVQVLVAHELVNSVYNDNSEYTQNFVSGNALQSLGLGSQPTNVLGEYIGNNDIIESEFGRGIYTYNNRYSITATIRADRSSKFAPGHQTGYFPSAAVSWRLSDEPFMQSIKNVADNIKIRVGYGETGNQSVPNYLYGASLNAIPTGLGNSFALANVAQANLTWETAIQKDLGIDFSLFGGRIEGTFDYFDKTSKNFLFHTMLPAFVLGGVADYNGDGVISAPYVNGGSISNKGFEFSITSKNIQGKDFKWNTSLNFSHYSNKVLSLANGTPYITGQITTSFLTLPVTRTQVGGPVGEFYGYKVKGIIKSDAQLAAAPIQFGQPVTSNPGGTWLGDIEYVDEDHNGKIDANDQVRLGSPNPLFTYGITNSFAYKSFDLSVFLNGSYGAKVLNALDYQIAGLGSLYQNQLASVANFWSPSNPNSNIPRPVAGNNSNLNVLSDRFIQSGSFLRVQNVSLGYNFPASIVRHLSVSRLRVYASAQNLYVFTPYKGLDPEIGAANQNVFLTGVDLGRYPSPRTITFGVNADF